MSRDPLARMDVDTRWAYHRKLRKLQRLNPEHWPTYWCAYLALLGEAWAAGKRSLTLEDTWVPATPCQPTEAMAALRAAGIVDKDGRVPLTSWRKWYEPVAKRLRERSDAGRAAAEIRWKLAHLSGTDAMRTHSARNAPRPAQPSTPVPRARARGNGKAAEEGKPWVALTEAEKAAAREADQQKIAKAMRDLGLPVEEVPA